MSKRTSAMFGAIVVAANLLIGLTHTSARAAPLPQESQSDYETLEAPVLKVFSTEQDGYKFIAYVVQWRDSEVIVSDPLARSKFREGDQIRFMAQRVSIPSKTTDVATLNFILLSDPSQLEAGEGARARDTARPAERKRYMKLVGGDLDSAKTPTERFYALNRAARNALKAGKPEQAQKLADELLKMAQSRSDDWNYGNAIQDSNQVLGLIALSKGDVDEAKERLLASADSDGSPQMNSFGPNMQLAKELLARGEKEVVLEYLELCGKFWKMGGERLTTWLEDVNQGRTPDFSTNLN